MMDLSSLNSTLPPALADAERDMGDKFRGKSYCRGRKVEDGRDEYRRQELLVDRDGSCRPAGSSIEIGGDMLTHQLLH